MGTLFFYYTGARSGKPLQNTKRERKNMGMYYSVHAKRDEMSDKELADLISIVYDCPITEEDVARYYEAVEAFEAAIGDETNHEAYQAMGASLCYNVLFDDRSCAVNVGKSFFGGYLAKGKPAGTEENEAFALLLLIERFGERAVAILNHLKTLGDIFVAWG
jgi:hypothetical protein